MSTKPSLESSDARGSRRPAPGVVGEIIEGVLHTMTSRVCGTSARRGPSAAPFDHGRGGPGGCWIVVEPGIELPAGAASACRSRRSTSRSACARLVCEIPSPMTRRHDLLRKRPYPPRSACRSCGSSTWKHAC